MKKLTLAIILYFAIFVDTACVKDNGCQNKTIQSEAGPIAAYAAANGISGTVHSSGLYYQVVTPGSGATPNVNSRVSVKYTGKLLNGTVFDSSTSPVEFRLGELIAGWQIGLQLLQKGGTIKLVVPSSLAYGCSENSSIPGNSILYFEIQLIDVM